MSCNSDDGNCDCKEGFAGRQCNICKPNYYGETCESKYTGANDIIAVRFW